PISAKHAQASRFLQQSRLNRGYGTGINFTNTRNFGFTGTVDIDLGGPALKSITAYRNLDTRFGQDLGNSPVVGFEGTFRVKQHQFSEELQLSGKAFNDKLDYLVGAYYFSEGGRDSEDVAFTGGLFQIVGNFRFNTKSYALFTHLNYRVNDLIGITLGGRYTKEDKTLVGSQRDLNMLLTKLGTPAFLFPDPTDLSQFYPTGEQKLSFSNVSPRVGIELHPTERIMLYGSFSKGFKSGGWTTRVSAPVPPDPTKPADKQAPSFNPEKADTFEIGFKSQLFDRMLQVNAAAFYTDYKGIQIQIQRGIGASFENAGNARIKGFEVETIFAPSRVFRVSASAGYIDAYYRRINDPSGTITLASRLPRVPKWTATLSPEFNVFLANEGRVTLRADYSYKSTMAADAENTPELFSGNVSLVNASLTYSAPGDDWSLAIGGNNVFNKRYIANGVNQLNGTGLLSAVPNRPSEYYATLRFKF
ncbi:TonB-dependent receptor, partial [Sphingobium sp. HDIP04]